MPVAEEFTSLLGGLAPPTDGPAADPPAVPAGPDEIRAMFAATSASWAAAPPPIAAVDDHVIPGPSGEIPVRIYTPEAGGAPLPVLVFFHGGGFFVGSIETHDPVCREIAARSNWIVVSADYRLAPEHLFPAAADDCFAALQWCADKASSFGGDPSRLAIGGDSAGGNLTAVTALRARDAGGLDLLLQVLVYPCVDSACATDSMTRNGEGFFMSADAIRMAWVMYAPELADRDSWEVSPLMADDLSGVAPALVITAEYDPLVDEGEAYAKRLFDAGVAVEVTRYDGMIHGFVQMTAITPRATEAVDQIAAALQRAVAATA